MSPFSSNMLAFLIQEQISFFVLSSHVKGDDNDNNIDYMSLILHVLIFILLTNN